jgi:hypothetical protein
MYCSEENLHSKVSKPTSKLYLIVSISTGLAIKRGDDDLSKERYFGKKNSCLSRLLAVGTNTVDNSS